MPALNYRLNHKSDPVRATPYLSFSSSSNPIPFVVKAAGDYIIPNLPPVLDQGQIGSCAANASAGALEILLNNEDPPALKMISRLHIYWIARALDGNTNQDAGTYLSSCALQMHKIGVCEEKYWPYVDETTKYLEAPPVEAEIRASENRITGAYKIMSEGAQRLADIALAVRANHPVIFGTQVGKAFMNTDGKTPLVPDLNDMEGGHATGLVGVQSIAGRLSFLDKNSWSAGWANNGYAWLDQDYMTWENTGDIWVLTRMSPLL